MTKGLSHELAAYVTGSRFNSIPANVRDHAVRAVFNGFGTALGGSSDPAITRLAETLAPFSSGGTSSVIGHHALYDMPSAAFLNAAAMNVFDFDDTHTPTIIHPTAPVLPAVLALGERIGASGTALLHATILGMEIACRLGNAVSPQHYARGWHISSTCGIFGAAAACAKLLDLKEEQIVWAFGNASAQASGLIETLGFMSKSVGMGGAARNGMMSALMAQRGVEGPPYPIEGPRGFLKVTCDNPRPELVTQSLGTQWEICRNMFKPYPCGVVLNPVIDACLAARARPDLALAQIKEIRVRGNPLLKARADRPDVKSGREAQVSAQHAIAVSLVRGTAGAAEFSDAAVADPEIQRFRQKVSTVETDEGIPVEAAALYFTLTNGETFSASETMATGSLQRPMDDRALVAKYNSLAAFGCPTLDAKPLAEALWNLPVLPDAGALLSLARPPK
jgi:2-methylcitrate dehydratase PrpD